MKDFEQELYFRFSIDNDKNIENLLQIKILEFLFYVFLRV